MVGRRPLSILAVALLLALVGLVPATNANHPQTAHGDTIVFDHKTGNEWWVEVVLSGGASGSVAGVQAMDTGGAWVPLQKKSWGAWAASFHIEPGHLVKFRATWTGGDLADSCWFTHPAGVEQCGTTTTTTSSSSSSTSGGTFAPAFTSFRGNEWWVQANVGTTSHCISSVHVRSNNGAWMPLTKQSWGPTAWAGSYHFPQGSVLQMRATSCTAQTDLSSCRQWIPPANTDATIVACPGTSSTSTSTGPQPFDATWTNVKGNQYWVEAVVKANAPIQMVLLMVNCDTQHDPGDMVYRADWGKWVIGNQNIPSGSVITMTAVGPNGATDTSATYLWPQGTVTKPCPEYWPQDGSTADVRFRDQLREYDEQGGETFTIWDGLVHTEWHAGTWIDEDTFDGNAYWEGTCEQLVSRRAPNGVWTNTTQTFEWDMAPPMGVVPGQPGATVDLETVGGGCQLAQFQSTVIGTERRTFSLRDSDGDPIPVTAYHAGVSSTGGFEDYWYDTRLGLMLSWHTHYSSPYHSSTSRGWLLDTDAEFY